MPLTRRADDGQVLPLFAVGVAAGGLLAFGIARLGADAVDQARARTAADAAALAGAAAGEGESRRLAELNGGQMRSFATVDGVVEVEVVLAGRTATARARPRPAPRLGSEFPAGGSEDSGEGKEPGDVHRRRSPAAPR